MGQERLCSFDEDIRVPLSNNDFLFFLDLTGPLSSGVATLRYMSIEPYVLSFNLGDEITIFSKEAGQNKELWGAEVSYITVLLSSSAFPTHNAFLISGPW